MIDADTAARIVEYERQRSQRPLMLWALAGLGVATIALGLVSVIAANWDGIGGQTKLALDAVLMILLAGGVWLAERRDRPLLTEVLVVGYYLFTLASIALVGQVYQLNTPAWQGLCLWTGCTLPLVLVGRGRFLAVLWFVGVCVTGAVGMEATVDYLQEMVSDSTLRNLLVAAAFAAPLLLLTAATVPAFVRARPVLAQTVSACVWACVAVVALASAFVWYERLSSDDTVGWGLLVAGAVTALWHAALPRLLPATAARTRAGLSAFVALTWLSAALSLGLERSALEAVGAIVQVAMLMLLAWTCARQGLLRLFHALTALIGLRVLVVYFEVFGSLLDTGLGLITGGALALLLAWLWHKRSGALAEQLTEADAHAD